jgi:hypothetical protein
MKRAILPLVTALALAGAAALAPSVARAQSPPQMQVHADADTVGVGDFVHLELVVQSSDGMPTQPDPGATPGFVVRGQSASPSQMRMSFNGVRTDRYSLTADWALQAQRLGTFTIGPPTVMVGGVRFSGRSLTLRVVPAAQVPPQLPPSVLPSPGAQPPFPFSPFDPWKGLFPGSNQGDPSRVPTPTPSPDPSLALETARGSFFFLHATADTTSVVVGQPVIFSVYAYVDFEHRANIKIDPTATHEPTAAEFVRHPLLREDQDSILVGFADVSGRIWEVSLENRWVLFPIHQGDLTIDPMSVLMVRPPSIAGTNRKTETLRVHVTEPPVAGRPPGYTLGDVGHFALAAQVTPRDLEQGGVVGVHVELSGTGNLPASLATPAREGIAWLAPEVHEQLGAVGQDKWGGKRTFDYVVRINRAGDVDLGELALPFWDPEQKRYDVAGAPLGVVHVAPSAAGTAAAGAGAGQETLSGLPAMRDKLEGAATAGAHVDDAPLFWLLGIGAWPIAFGVAVAGRATGRRIARTWTERKASPVTELRARVSAANAACARQDARAVDAAIARALEAATVAHAGVSVRGAVGDEVADRLERAGIAKDAASRVAELLRECEAARFAPEAADVVRARDRWTRAQGAIRLLEKT